MLVDLRAAADELGIVPYTREEIRWIRKIRQPERAEFWSQAVSATTLVPASRREELELRDIAIVVAAALHEPELLQRSEAQLLAELEADLKGRKHFVGTSRVDGPDADSRQRLRDVRDHVTWGDLAAIRMALQAIDVPQVAGHLFDYARRDREDKTTEYGGVIALDRKGRFEVLEYPPRIRHHDQKFIASQAMFDAGYTALFHFHYHVQRSRNEEFAGPGLGDARYAENTRVNCLVLTSVNEDRLNVDFYRHGRVVVDLGTIERP
jgi:hypothetical protein